MFKTVETFRKSVTRKSKICFKVVIEVLLSMTGITTCEIIAFELKNQNKVSWPSTLTHKEGIQFPLSVTLKVRGIYNIRLKTINHRKYQTFQNYTD